MSAAAAASEGVSRLKAFTDYVRLFLNVNSFDIGRRFNTMDHSGTADAEDDSGSLPRLAPSPHSEAVAHEFKELSLQPNQYLPPLNERKNAVGQDNYPQALDDYSFDEDSSDALSPDQPASQESQGSAASPGELKTSDSPSPITPNAATSTQERNGIPIEWNSSEKEKYRTPLLPMKKKRGNLGTLPQEKTEEEESWGAVASSEVTVSYCVLPL
ncbi:myocardin-related transcription factor B [Grus japonensis]|uniref:Myocardin-related transcription factor B n=1 Tax=Grus japonensis TaxID=30415 RepID=A0ABC9XG87_GRUJA